MKTTEKGKGVTKERFIYRLIVLFAVTAIALFPACKKSSPRTPAKPQVGPYLYIGGTDGANGIYYKISLTDSAPLTVQDTIQGANNVISIVTLDSDLYIAGGAGGYWKNGSFVSVTGANAIDYVALSGSNVFSLGLDYSEGLAWWAGNQETNIANTLPGLTYNIEIRGIAAADSNAGTNVYVAATANFRFDPSGDDPSGYYGVFWENGHWQLFGGNSPGGAEITTGIVRSGTDVYVAGIGPADSTNIYGGGYWKNGVWNLIHTPFIPDCIAGSGNNIYVGGMIYTPPVYQAGYWENGSMISLPGGINAIAIAFNGSDVYVLGTNSNDVNVVWKNGVLFMTLDPNVAFSAYCLAVGQ
jgi:hypothetical protein